MAIVVPPLLAELLLGVGRVGVRAAESAIESVLEDVDEVADEVKARTKKARGRMHKRPRKGGE